MLQLCFIYGNMGTGTAQCHLNFGQKPFKFPPPDGFQPLNTANTRPVKVISRPDQYVGVTTYKGTVTSKTFSLNHSPDFLWMKQGIELILLVMRYLIQCSW